jgi:hypothetical protein
MKSGIRFERSFELRVIDPETPDAACRFSFKTGRKAVFLIDAG